MTAASSVIGYGLRVARAGTIVLEVAVSKMYARSIALVVLVGAEHCAERPTHATAFHSVLARLIEASLQDTPQAHRAWTTLLTSSDREPVDVQLIDLGGANGAAAQTATMGGAGGGGAWPAGGGGGGGAGLVEAADGGDGANGAIAILHFDPNDDLVDIEAFVTPGSFQYPRPAHTTKIKVCVWGAGGGGGGG